MQVSKKVDTMGFLGVVLFYLAIYLDKSLHDSKVYGTLFLVASDIRVANE